MNAILWAIAYQHGGEIKIDRHSIEQATTPIVEMVTAPDCITIRALPSLEWPKSEDRIDIIGSNGNTGEHYDDVN